MRVAYILLILFLTIGLNENVFAQLGDKSIGQYIVHNIGDTLYGNVTLDKTHIHVSYVDDKGKDIKRKFSYNEVKTYKYESGNIIHRRFYTSYKGRPLELLIKGKINLYYEEIEGSTFDINGGGGYYSYEMYYIEKEGVFKGMNPMWLTKKGIAKYIKDDAISAKRLKNKRLTVNMKNVKLLIEDYNKRN